MLAAKGSTRAGCLCFVAVSMVFLSTVATAQPPAVEPDGVRNEASLRPPSLPDSALVPGSRVLVRGVRFGAAPLNVNLTSGFQKATVVVKPESDTRLVFVLPRDIALGNATMQLRTEQQPSDPVPIRIGAGAPGLYTKNGRGWGAPLIVPDRGTFYPGEWITLRATGIEPSGHPTASVGGKAAETRRPRPHAGTPGAYDLDVRIPMQAPSGCAVPVMIGPPDGPSNTITLSIGPARGQPCAAPGAWPRFTSAATALLLLVRTLLRLEAVQGVPVESTTDGGFASFFRSAKGSTILDLIPPNDTCTTYAGEFTPEWASPSMLAGAIMQSVSATPLDAGAPLTLTSRQGSRTLVRHPRQPGLLAAPLGESSEVKSSRAKPLFLEAGEVRIQGLGGTDVGPFTGAVSVSAPLQWLNRESAVVIDRQIGVDIRWQGAAGGRVGILAMNVSPTAGMAVCFCAAKGESGRFHVPAAMLAHFPISTVRPGLPLSLLMVTDLSRFQNVRAPGIDHGYAAAFSIVGSSVTYR